MFRYLKYLTFQLFSVIRGIIAHFDTQIADWYLIQNYVFCVYGAHYVVTC